MTITITRTITITMTLTMTITITITITKHKKVTEATYDFRRHHRECEHLNFLTLSKVRNIKISY